MKTWMEIRPDFLVKIFGIFYTPFLRNNFSLGELNKQDREMKHKMKLSFYFVLITK